MKSIFQPRNLIVLSIAMVGYGIWKYDTFRGYYEFKKLCEKEAGLHVFEKVEKNVGWEADALSTARAYQRRLNHVSFVRAPNDVTRQAPSNLQVGELVDVTFKGGDAWGLDSSYNMSRANLSIATRYKITSAVDPANGSRQLNKITHQIIDLRTDTTAVRWIQYSYKWRNPEQPFLSLLGPSGITRCHDTDSTTNFDELNINIFKE